MRNRLLGINLPLPVLIGALLAWLASSLLVSAQSANADFKQAVKAYQQSRSDADAEKVIKLALTLDPKARTPEQRHQSITNQTAMRQTKW